MHREIRQPLASAALILNLASMVYGIYFIAAGRAAVLPTLFGIALLAALALNLLLVLLNYIKGAGVRLQRWGTAYLIISMAAMGLMGLGEMVAASAYAPRTEALAQFFLVYPGYFAVLIVGVLQARLTRNLIGDCVNQGGNPAQPSRGRILLLIMLFLVLLSGVFNAYILLADYAGLLQILISQSALFLAFFYAALTLWILKIYGKPGCPLNIFIGLAGLALFIVFLLPLLLIPGAAKQAEDEFKAVFGEDWPARLDPAAEKYFLKHRFSLPAYFLGYPQKGYTVEHDLLFYEGTEGVDQGIKLYFDVYKPLLTQPDLPGYGT
ncbi:MAG TPA: hypothetical protein PLY40_02385, partial [Bacillota bacterium]|nr:hypothetical protein [Bacillota bacterium]